ncbi:hypothetical protein ACLB2K_029962 [Fragaria x ananassa]
MSSRDPYLQFAWDSTVSGEGELEMTNNALGIRSQSPSGLVSDFPIVALLALTIMEGHSLNGMSSFTLSSSPSESIETSRITPSPSSPPPLVAPPPVVATPQLLAAKYKSNLKEVAQRRIDEVVQTLTSLFNFYTDNDPVAATASRNVTMPMVESRQQEVDEDSHAANLHMFKLLRQEKDVVIKNELDKYLLETAEDLSNSKFEILGWWKENVARYPILSKIAKDVFVVPASTVAFESAFSLGKKVVDPFRASLTPNMVEGLVCLSDWLRAKGFQTYKEPTKDEMEMYEELEKLEIGEGDVSARKLKANGTLKAGTFKNP